MRQAGGVVAGRQAEVARGALDGAVAGTQGEGAWGLGLAEEGTQAEAARVLVIAVADTQAVAGMAAAGIEVRMWVSTLVHRLVFATDIIRTHTTEPGTMGCPIIIRLLIILRRPLITLTRWCNPRR